MSEAIIVLAAIVTILVGIVPVVRGICRRVRRNRTNGGQKSPSGETIDQRDRMLQLLQASSFLSKHVIIHGYYEGIPILTSLGKLKVDNTTRSEAAKLKRTMTIDLDSRYAVLKTAECLHHRFREWEYYYTDFATILARRKMAAENPRDLSKQALLQVSACAVVFCEETREVLLHRRSASSHSFPGRYHTFGGGYIVPEHVWKSDRSIKPTPSRQDKDGIVQTAFRELQEESGLVVSRTAIDSVRKALITELDTGYVQFVALGIDVPRRQMEADLRDELKEGDVIRCPFDRLSQLVTDPSVWVPTGLTHVLLWLSRAVQLDGTQLEFGTETGEQLVKRAIQELDKSEESDLHVLNY